MFRQHVPPRLRRPHGPERRSNRADPTAGGVQALQRGTPDSSLKMRVPREFGRQRSQALTNGQAVSGNTGGNQKRSGALYRKAPRARPPAQLPVDARPVQRHMSACFTVKHLRSRCGMTGPNQCWYASSASGMADSARKRAVNLRSIARCAALNEKRLAARCQLRCAVQCDLPHLGTRGPLAQAHQVECNENAALDVIPKSQRDVTGVEKVPQLSETRVGSLSAQWQPPWIA